MRRMGPVCLIRLLLVLAFSHGQTARSDGPQDVIFHKYIIIGAGPGGLQLAHYLDSAGRDYLIIDKADSVAAFFQRYPRWRQLISINKFNVGSDHLDFALRHDWNSLLLDGSTSGASNPTPALSIRCPGNHIKHNQHDDVSGEAHRCWAKATSSSDNSIRTSSVPKRMRFTDYSNEYYPQADDLVRYFQYYASHAGRDAGSLRMRLNTTVTRISAVARALQPSTEHSTPPRFSITTKDGTRLQCTYLIWAAGITKAQVTDGIGLIDIGTTYSTASTNLTLYADKRVLIIGRGNGAMEFANSIHKVAAYVHIAGRATSGRIRLSWETHYTGDVRMVHSHLLEAYNLKSQDGFIELPLSSQNFTRVTKPDGTTEIVLSQAKGSSESCEVDPAGVQVSACSPTAAYDIVISCPGYMFDGSVFDDNVRPMLAPNGKHPAINPSFEAQNVPGLYFAGAAMHALDHRKASGGFIHGFRYLIRALHRHLEEQELKEEAKEMTRASGWPRRLIDRLDRATDEILHRINHASGLYQEFGFLADVVLLRAIPAVASAGFVTGGVRSSDALWPREEDPRWKQPASGDGWSAADGRFPKQLGRNNSIGLDGLHRLDAAIAGVYFEEVPMPLIPYKLDGWAMESETGQSCEYITVTLEYGPGEEDTLSARVAVGTSPVTLEEHKWSATQSRRPSLSEYRMQPSNDDPYKYWSDGPSKGVWKRDAFARNRVNGTVDHPEGSVLIHPVVRYWHSCIAPGVPLLTQHLLEDVSLNFSHPLKHRLPIARFVQHVAATRLRLARDTAQSGSVQVAITPDGASSIHSIQQTSGTPTAGSGIFYGLARDAYARWATRAESRSGGDASAANSDGTNTKSHAEALLAMADALSFSSSALFYRGYRIPLSRGWRSCVMSIEASDEMLYASTAFVVHFRPAATTTGVDLPDLRGTRASLRLAWGGAGAVSAIANDTDSEGENNNGDVFADRSHPLYQLMGAPLPGKDANPRLTRGWDLLYSAWTAALPGVALITADEALLPVRRVAVMQHGILELPSFAVFRNGSLAQVLSPAKHSNASGTGQEYLATVVTAMQRAWRGGV